MQAGTRSGTMHQRAAPAARRTRTPCVSSLNAKPSMPLMPLTPASQVALLPAATSASWVAWPKGLVRKSERPITARGWGRQPGAGRAQVRRPHACGKRRTGTEHAEHA